MELDFFFTSEFLQNRKEYNAIHMSINARMQDTVQFTLIYKWLFTLLYVHKQSDLANANSLGPLKMQIKRRK